MAFVSAFSCAHWRRALAYGLPNPAMTCREGFTCERENAAYT
jgi:hypothetical protein